MAEIYEMKLVIKLSSLLMRHGMQQKDLVELIDEHRRKKSIETGEPFKKTRPAAISEIYNNQRKSLNKELIEEIATVLKITDPNELFDFYPININQLQFPLQYRDEIEEDKD